MLLSEAIKLLERFSKDSELIAVDWSPGYQVRVDRNHLRHPSNHYFMDFDVDCSDEWLKHCGL